jgi:hypothetical protein
MLNGRRVTAARTLLNRGQQSAVSRRQWAASTAKKEHSNSPLTIHHSPSACSRILNAKSCQAPRSMLAYLLPFVKRHRVAFGSPREAFPRSMDGLPPPGRVPVVCFGTRLARSPARERVKKPMALTTEIPRRSAAWPHPKRDSPCSPSLQRLNTEGTGRHSRNQTQTLLGK